MWRGLLSRAALLEVRAQHLGAFSSLVDSGSVVVRKVLDGLHLSAASGGEAVSDAKAIALAEHCWQRELGRALATPRLTNHETNLQRLSASSPNGASADPFAALYQGVVDRVVTLYGGLWPDDLRLDLVPLEDHPRSPADAYALSGQTTSTPKGVVVELQVHPDGLGPATFLVIPVVFAHECVCHVVPCAAGQLVNDESAFAEGLMDWASLHHVRRWLPQLWPAMAGAARSHAKLFSAVAVPKGHRSYSPRIVGWQAAEELVSQLTPPGAWRSGCPRALSPPSPCA
jgi:hypothetical protein